MGRKLSKRQRAARQRRAKRRDRWEKRMEIMSLPQNQPNWSPYDALKVTP